MTIVFSGIYAYRYVRRWRFPKELGISPDKLLKLRSLQEEMILSLPGKDNNFHNDKKASSTAPGKKL